MSPFLDTSLEQTFITFLISKGGQVVSPDTDKPVIVIQRREGIGGVCIAFETSLQVGRATDDFVFEKGNTPEYQLRNCDAAAL